MSKIYNHKINIISAIIAICWGVSFIALTPSVQAKDSEAVKIAKQKIEELRKTRAEKKNKKEKEILEKRQSQGLLTDEQINLLKIYEIDPANKPRVQIPQAVIDKFLMDYHDDPDVPKTRRQKQIFKKWKNYRKLDLLFELKARELYNQVTVESMPQTVKTFRNNVYYNYVISYCAATGCHGEKSDSDYKLITHNTKSLPSLYTNFYLLNTYNQSGYEMVDRQKIDLSLLLQYGLKRELAENPHPKTKKWRSRFNNTKNKLYLEIRDWLESLPTNKIKYPFTLKATIKEITPSKKTTKRSGINNRRKREPTK